MKSIFTTIIALCLLFLPSFAQAQRIPGPEKLISKFKKDNDNLFAFQSNLTEIELQDYLGNCGTVSNLSFIGVAEQLGKFEQTTTKSGLKKGLIIASGKVSNANGPNVSSSITSNEGNGSDPDLASIAEFNALYDASGFEFDLTATSENFSVWTVFGSDEYPEFVGSSFNDIFAVLFREKSDSVYANIASIPGTYIPIRINTVNELQDSFNSTKYYISNPEGSIGIEYDGYTIPLLVQHSMTIGTT